MPHYILAHDLGTSGNKASLFSEDGTLVQSETVHYRTFYPSPECAEQNPNDWWSAVCKATKKITSFIDVKDIAAIAFSGQMMGCLCVDVHGTPLMNSIIWADGRATNEAAYLIDQLGMQNSCYTVGQRISSNYTLPKLMWLKKNQPEVYKKTYKVLQAKDYMIFKMTGHMVTEPTDACYTQAFDIHKGQWSDIIISCADVRSDLFPRVVASDEVVGKLTEKAALECGLISGIPVVAGAGDGSAAHIGAGCIENNDTYVSLGSSSWIMTVTDKEIFDEKCRMQYEPHVIKGKFVLGGTMQTGGLSLNWARQELMYRHTSFEKINKMIELSSPGANGVLFLPYLMGERSPWWNVNASGVFHGIRLTTSKNDMLRAVMEGVAYNLCLILNIIRQHLDVKNVRLISSGARNKVWCQMLSDVFGIPALLPNSLDEGTAIGAAVIAGVGVGLFSDYSVTRKFVTINQEIRPNPLLLELYNDRIDAFSNLYYSICNL